MSRVTLGTFLCKECGCCEKETSWYAADEFNRACEECGCYEDRDAHTKIRLYVYGALTIERTEQILANARVMGAPNDAEIIRVNNRTHYLEFDGNGLSAQLEIAGLRAAATKEG